jgi:hypothetical protein
MTFLVLGEGLPKPWGYWVFYWVGPRPSEGKCKKWLVKTLTALLINNNSNNLSLLRVVFNKPIN